LRASFSPDKVHSLLPPLPRRQAQAIAIEAERDTLRERLEALSKRSEEDDGATSLRDRVLQLEATQGHLAVQHGMEVHDIDRRMHVT